MRACAVCESHGYHSLSIINLHALSCRLEARGVPRRAASVRRRSAGGGEAPLTFLACLPTLRPPARRAVIRAGFRFPTARLRVVLAGHRSGLQPRPSFGSASTARRR